MGAHGLPEVAEALAFGLREICGFERIFGEVVEFPGSHGRIFDELPRVAPHRPGNFSHVAEVPFSAGEEEISFEWDLHAGFEEWQEGISIDADGGFSSCGFEGGGEEVHGERGEVGRSRFDHLGPDGAGGDLEPAFVHVLLAAAELATFAADVQLATIV